MQTLHFEKIQMRIAELGKGSGLPDLLGTSVLQNGLQFSLGEREEIFEGYGRIERMYPYRQNDDYRRELKLQTTQAAILENDHLRAVILTEFGGRLWELWDKKKGKDLLYTNDVIRFSNLATRNAWFSGGVEWNIGVIGHSPFTTEPLYTARSQTDDGSPVLRMYQYEQIRKAAWQIDLWLGEDPYLNCAVRISNESTDVIPMYWWSNIAVPEHDGGRIIVPADSAYTNKHNVVYKVDIPMVDGVDITRPQDIPYSVDYFFDIPERSPKYIASVDADGYGLLHVSSSRLRSRKLFSWGHQEASMHWQKFLTDQQGPYIEIQAGLGKTQYGCIPMAPHTTWEWIERYGAVEIPVEDMDRPHAERSARLTSALLEQKLPETLERLTTQWHFFAKKEAELVHPGKQHGIIAAQGGSTKHLKFDHTSESLSKWKEFFQSGVLHQPDPLERPDAFTIDQTNISFMEQACLRAENAGNWYAFYHLGLGYFIQGAYERAAKELERSELLLQNPWAEHALSCTYLTLGNQNASIEYILAGMRTCSKDVSYLKEGFRILMLNGAFKTICDFYAQLDAEEQDISRLKYYHADALARTGNYADALHILEHGDGIELEDVREGESSIQELWEVCYEKVHGEKSNVPDRYLFSISETIE